MFTTGKRTDAGQFSKDVVGTVIGDYIHIARQLSDRRWDRITALCDDTSSELINNRPYRANSTGEPLGVV